MTGWRLGMAVGNAEMIEALRVVKSNLDSGVPQAVQRMGIAALSLRPDAIDERNTIYQRRMDRIVEALKSIGLSVERPKASLYVWARVPEGYTSAEFSERLLDERDVLVSAGSGYGKYGEGYVRLSMTVSDEGVDKAANRISSWKAPAPAGAGQ
jgi:LL-diaminopimelate aminotransferase